MSYLLFRPKAFLTPLSLLVPLTCVPAVLAQTTPNYNDLFQAVITKHGERTLQARNSQVTGTITYRGESVPNPFLFTLEKLLSRLEISKPTGNLTIVRQVQRVQSTLGQKRNLPESSPFSSSGSNLIPVLALINFHNHPACARAVVQQNGTTGLRYLEGSPPGVAPLISFTNLIATFWLDSSNRITQISYTDTQNQRMPVTYLYSYSETALAPFLRPDLIQAFSGELKAYEARLSSLLVDVPLPNDFFEIAE